MRGSEKQYHQVNDLRRDVAFRHTFGFISAIDGIRLSKNNRNVRCQ